MLGFMLAVIINIAPIVDMHLDTAEGKQELAQKLKVQADAMAQKWADVRQLQVQLQQKLALLDNTPKDSAEWKMLAAECDALGEQWKEKTAEFSEYREFIQTAAIGIHQTQRILSLVERYQNGDELTDAEIKILETFSKICQ